MVQESEFQKEHLAWARGDSVESIDRAIEKLASAAHALSLQKRDLTEASAALQKTAIALRAARRPLRNFIAQNPKGN